MVQYSCCRCEFSLPKYYEHNGSFTLGFQKAWNGIDLIAKTSVVLLAIALSPVILSWLAKKHFKGKNYSRSGVAGFLSTLLAILTGATGLVSVTQNCFECLMVSLKVIQTILHSLQIHKFEPMNRVSLKWSCGGNTVPEETWLNPDSSKM